MHPEIILIHPPVSKPSEPPAGIARLAGCLQAHRIEHQIIDANLEGILYLLENPAANNHAPDRWTTRALRHLRQNLSALRNHETYKNKSRYQRVVNDLNHLLHLAGENDGIELSLSDYHDGQLKPVASGDLFCAASNPSRNPFYPYFSLRLESALSAEPDFIGFSLNYLSQALCTFAMIGFIKEKNPRQKIILGGSLTTSWMKITDNHNIFCGLIDEMVAGPGENRLLALLKREKDRTDYLPLYNDFPLKNYLAPALVLPYSASHGCYWHQCSFCPETSEKNSYQPQSAKQSLEQLRILVNDLHPGLIHLLDNAISPAFLAAFADHSPGVPWYGFTRITPHLTDEDFCCRLKQSGCLMLKLGIESGDQGVLDKLHKGIDLSVVSGALRSLHKAGIATYIYLLFGTPPENEDSAFKTLHFVVDHHDCIDFLNLAIFNLPALSHDAEGLVTTDFYEGDLSLYKSFNHPAGWQRSLVRRFLEKTFKKHPAVMKIVGHTPNYFTSNHAPFFLQAGAVRPSSQF